MRAEKNRIMAERKGEESKKGEEMREQNRGGEGTDDMTTLTFWNFSEMFL